MLRWDYDTVFYRVFCITLLAVACTFTVILTNVFVDIDGLLSKKDKATTPKPESELKSNYLAELSDVIHVNRAPDDKPEDDYDDKDYQESNDLFRSKRSLDTRERLFRIKDPKIKELLTNHLANLLDELDEEESITNVKQYNKDSASNVNNKITIIKIPRKIETGNQSINNVKKVRKNQNPIKIESDEVIEYSKNNKGKLQNKTDETENVAANTNKANNDEILRLAMQNIILQGILGSMNLDDISKKVAGSMKHFQSGRSNINGDIRALFKETSKKPKEETEEETPLHEIVNVMESVKERNTDNVKRNVNDDDDNIKIRTNKIIKATDHNIIIKTIIDIKDLSNDKPNKEGILKSKDRINGVVKLIYNGNVMKFKKIDNVNNTSSRSYSKGTKKIYQENTNNIKQNNGKTKSYNISNQNYFNKLIHDYLKKFDMKSDSSEHEKVYSNDRPKRDVKIRFDNDKQEKTTAKPKSKKDDDELFVEIETHFDSKGTKGEKKKKLIRDLIQKIQNAIHSDKDVKKKKPKHWHVKKRIQNSLSSRNAATLLNKLMLPSETLAKRHLDPISKVVSTNEQVPLVPNILNQNYVHKTQLNPKFLDKAINSAEMNTVDTDYSKVMRHNGIPQRLQKPLHSDISDELFQDSSIVEIGNIKFLMKDIDGTGFSIGFNQYTDEAPDPETMKLFSGLQNVIQTYHQKYDQESSDYPQQINYDKTQYSGDFDENQEQNQEEQLDKSDQHLIKRRSIKGSDQQDQHTNGYRIVYNRKYLPYDNYQEIYETNKGHLTNVKNLQMYKTKLAKKSTLFIDDNVFEKDLKPAEILSIADLFQRRKRSLSVKKMSNVKIGNTIRRKFLNTNKMLTQNLFRNKKRNKRQIDKIRIIAREMPQTRMNSEEDIFVVSDEKMFADRALVKEVEVPEISQNEKLPSVEHYDIVSSSKKEEDPDDIVPKETEDHFDVVSPYFYETSPYETKNEFTRRARHNSLMSKYPHIIMSDTQRFLDATDDTFPENNYYMETSTKAIIPPILDTAVPDEKDITELLSPPIGNGNYKLSIKIRPKNATSMSGFKEVHTSINKSYNKNGLMYTSLVNVSQLSKVEKINKTIASGRRELEKKDFDHTSIVSIKQLQELMKSLVRQHKNRLDHQLKQLQMEKDKLDSIIVGNTDITSETTDLGFPKTKLLLTQGEGRKVYENIPTEISEVTAQPIATEPTTSTTTTAYVQPITEDVIKTKMIYSIERNENVTKELLKKIDQNTGVLKTFLGKLIANMEVTTNKAVTESQNERTFKENQERQLNKNELNRNSNNLVQTKQSNIGNNQMPFNFEDYHQHIPNLFFRTDQRNVNNTMGIPFVYAYQQPYSMVTNKQTPMASVVYHGHIHTDTIYKDKKRENTFENNNVKKTNDQINEKKGANEQFWKPKPGEKVLHDFVLQNNNKFFLEQPTNDFKVVPVNAESKSHLSSVNNTKF